MGVFTEEREEKKKKKRISAPAAGSRKLFLPQSSSANPKVTKPLLRVTSPLPSLCPPQPLYGRGRLLLHQGAGGSRLLQPWQLGKATGASKRNRIRWINGSLQTFIKINRRKKKRGGQWEKKKGQRMGPHGLAPSTGMLCVLLASWIARRAKSPQAKPR